MVLWQLKFKVLLSFKLIFFFYRICVFMSLGLCVHMCICLRRCWSKILKCYLILQPLGEPSLAYWEFCLSFSFAIVCSFWKSVWENVSVCFSRTLLIVGDFLLQVFSTLCIRTISDLGSSMYPKSKARSWKQGRPAPSVLASEKGILIVFWIMLQRVTHAESS